ILQRPDDLSVALFEFGNQLGILYAGECRRNVGLEEADYVGQLLQGNFGVNPWRILQVAARRFEDFRDLPLARNHRAQALRARSEVALHDQEDGIRSARRVLIGILAPHLHTFQFQQARFDRRGYQVAIHDGIWRKVGLRERLELRLEFLHPCNFGIDGWAREVFEFLVILVKAVGSRHGGMILEIEIEVLIDKPGEFRGPGFWFGSAKNGGRGEAQQGKAYHNFEWEFGFHFRRFKNGNCNYIDTDGEGTPLVSSPRRFCRRVKTSSAFVAFRLNLNTPSGVNCAPRCDDTKRARRSGSTVAFCVNLMLTCSRLRSIAATPTRIDRRRRVA